MSELPNDANEAQSRLERINPTRGQSGQNQPYGRNDPEPQDLHVSKLASPDQNWRRTQPIQIVPSQKRLDAPHQIVTVSNDSHLVPANMMGPKPQTHIVLDRFMVGHELLPGQTKEVDMLQSDIEYFLSQRAPGRTDVVGRPVPKHPIRFVGFNEERWHRENSPRQQRSHRLTPAQALTAQQWPSAHPMAPEQDERDRKLEREHDWRHTNQPSNEEVEERDNERAEREREEQQQLQRQAGMPERGQTTSTTDLSDRLTGGSDRGRDQGRDRDHDRGQGKPGGNKPEGGKPEGNKSEGNKSSDKDDKNPSKG